MAEAGYLHHDCFFPSAFSRYPRVGNLVPAIMLLVGSLPVSEIL